MNRVEKYTQEEIDSKIKVISLMVEILDMENRWATEKDVYEQFNMNGRTFRKLVEDNLWLYTMGYTNKLIISSNKGYTYTDNNTEIKDYLERKQNQFKSLAYNYYHLYRAVEHDDNLTIGDVIERTIGE